MFGLFLLMVEFVLVILNNKESGRFAKKKKEKRKTKRPSALQGACPRIQRLETSIPKSQLATDSGQAVNHHF